MHHYGVCKATSDGSTPQPAAAVRGVTKNAIGNAGKLVLESEVKLRGVNETQDTPGSL